MQNVVGVWSTGDKIHRFDATQYQKIGGTRCLQSRSYYLVPYCSCLRLTCILIDISLDLFENDVKSAVVIIRFMRDEPPVAEPKIPAKVPPELHPDFVPSKDPSFPEKKMQIVGYQSRDISKDQVNILLKHLGLS